MNTLVIAIILGSLLVSSMFYFLINAFKKLKITISPGPSPASAPAPAPAPSNSVVTITNDGIQISKPSTTEGYVLNGSISCDPDWYTSDLTIQTEEGETPADFMQRKNEIQQRETSWCTLAGITDPKGFITAYQYHDGDSDASVWDSDTKKCAFSQDPYACVYKEVKDDDGNVIAIKNNDGKKLEVEFYNDYKSGKLQTYMEKMKYGTDWKFYFNSEGKLEFWSKFSDKGEAKKLVIKPGYNYQVAFMMLGTAVAMADSGIDMPVDGVSIKIAPPLSEEEIAANMQNDLVDA